jgi:serine/threonine-protein kinase HipA
MHDRSVVSLRPASRMSDGERVRLDVYLSGDRLGHLERLGPSRYRFAYGQAVVESHGEGAIVLSASLPVRTPPYPNAQTKPFFEGLLPEGVIRQEVSRALGISESNGFGLLEALGVDCAGAVVIEPPGHHAEEREHIVWLTEGQVAEKLGDLHRHPLGIAPKEGIRLSLGGVQQKLVVTRAPDGRIGQPAGGAPSTHILKPRQEAYPELVANEAFCLAVARCAGLDAARAEVARFGEIECLMVERFDRTTSEGGSIVRLHQEDFCQALGILPSAKYESEGGPSVRRIVDLLREFGTARDLRAFVLGLLLNFVIGNSDAHGKNFALLYDEPGAVRLAPLYDLVCTAVYDQLTTRLAMRIGGEDDPDQIDGRAWARMLEESGFRPQPAQLERDLQRIVRCADATLAAAHAEGWHRPILDEIAAVAHARSENLAGRS